MFGPNYMLRLLDRSTDGQCCMSTAAETRSITLLHEHRVLNAVFLSLTTGNGGKIWKRKGEEKRSGCLDWFGEYDYDYVYF